MPHLRQCRHVVCNFMRYFLIIIIALIALTTQAQKYSKIVNDSDILNFMTWLLSSDTLIAKNHAAKRHVDNDIRQLAIENFKYLDTSKTNNFLSNIFAYKNHLDSFLTENDANNFIDQIRNQITYKWNFKIKNIKLFDEVELFDNKLDKVLYSYSLPLFSIDKRRVIIIQAFFCGLVCGGGEYCLYEKQYNSSWKKIWSFNNWAE